MINVNIFIHHINGAGPWDGVYAPNKINTDNSIQYKHIKQGNSVARDLPPTGSEANTTFF